MQVEFWQSSIHMMIHNLTYQLIYFDSDIFKGLSQIKAIASEEQERRFAALSDALWDSGVLPEYFGKTTEDMALASPCLPQMLSTETSPLQSQARRQCTAKLTTAQVSVFPAVGALSCTYLICPVSHRTNELQRKEIDLYCR